MLPSLCYFVIVAQRDRDNPSFPSLLLTAQRSHSVLSENSERLHSRPQTPFIDLIIVYRFLYSTCQKFLHIDLSGYLNYVSFYLGSYGPREPELSGFPTTVTLSPVGGLAHSRCYRYFSWKLNWCCLWERVGFSLYFEWLHTINTPKVNCLKGENCGLSHTVQLAIYWKWKTQDENSHDSKGSNNEFTATGNLGVLEIHLVTEIIPKSGHVRPQGKEQLL